MDLINSSHLFYLNKPGPILGNEYLIKKYFLNHSELVEEIEDTFEVEKQEEPDNNNGYNIQNEEDPFLLVNYMNRPVDPDRPDPGLREMFETNLLYYLDIILTTYIIVTMLSRFYTFVCRFYRRRYNLQERPVPIQNIQIQQQRMAVPPRVMMSSSSQTEEPQLANAGQIVGDNNNTISENKSLVDNNEDLEVDKFEQSGTGDSNLYSRHLCQCESTSVSCSSSVDQDCCEELLETGMLIGTVIIGQ